MWLLAHASPMDVAFSYYTHAALCMYSNSIHYIGLAFGKITITPNTLSHRFKREMTAKCPLATKNILAHPIRLS